VREAAPARPRLTAPEVVAEARLVRALAADDGALYWADLDGVWTHAPGGRARRLAPLDASSLAVRGGVVGAAGARGAVRIGADGAATALPLAGAVIAAGPAGVFAGGGAAGRAIVEVDGARVVRRAAAAGEVTALAVGDRAVYWAEWDPGGHAGAIRRLGAAAPVARVAGRVAGIAIARGRPLWTGDGAALATAGPGGREQIEIAGRGTAIAADGDGVVIHTDHGLVIERAWHPDGSTADYAVDGADRTRDLSPPALAIDRRGAYEVAVRPDGAEDIIATPRPGRGPRVVALPPREVTLLAGAGGALFAAYTSADDVDTVAEVRIDGGAQVGAGMEVGALAASGGQVWAFDARTGAIEHAAPGGAWQVATRLTPLAYGLHVVGLQIAGGTAYWVDGGGLWRLAPGAEPRAIWGPELVGAPDLPLTSLAVIGDRVALTSAGFVAGDLTVIDAAGTPQVLAEATDQALGERVAGDGHRVYYVVGGHEVWSVGLDRTPPRRELRGDDPVLDLAAGPGHLVAAVSHDRAVHVVTARGGRAIDLGAARGLVPGTLIVAGDDAIWYSSSYQAVLRRPLPAAPAAM
jgi:hypothetical protein